MDNLYCESNVYIVHGRFVPALDWPAEAGLGYAPQTREEMHKIDSMAYTACGIALANGAATYAVTSFWDSTTCVDCRASLRERLEDAAEGFEYVIDHDPGGLVELLLEAAAAVAARGPFNAPSSLPAMSASG